VNIAGEREVSGVLAELGRSKLWEREIERVLWEEQQV
jgi:hypothetical protein